MQPFQTFSAKFLSNNNNNNNNACLPGIKEAGPQDHDCLTGALLQLGLDRAELAVDDRHHALDFPRSHGPCTRLLPEQVHHMGGEFSACLVRRGTRRRTVKEGNVQSNDAGFII